MGNSKPKINFRFQKFVFYSPPDAEKFADFSGTIILEIAKIPIRYDGIITEIMPPGGSQLTNPPHIGYCYYVELTVGGFRNGIRYYPARSQ